MARLVKRRVAGAETWVVGRGSGLGSGGPGGHRVGRSRRRVAGLAVALGFATAGLVVVRATVGVAALLVLGFLAGLLTAMTVPRAVGWDAHLVVSGSMAPAIDPGDVVLTAATPRGSPPPVGAVVVVAPAWSGGRPYVHRVVAISAGKVRTRGDANATVDPVAVGAERVAGEVRLVVPAVGLPSLWLAQGRPGSVAGAVVALGLVADAAVGWIRGAAPRP